MARLSDTHRTEFVLFEVEGFSHAEIAGMLDITEAASKNRLFEAKRALREMLKRSDSWRVTRGEKRKSKKATAKSRREILRASETGPQDDRIEAGRE